MGLQTLKRWGNDSIRGREGELVKPPEPIGCDQMSMGEHINLNYLFVLCPQSFIPSRSWLRQLIPWEKQGMEV